MRCVIGLMFDPTYSRVVLIRKTHPTWQAGLLNAPGGKIEPDEFSTAAIDREFEEETGLKVANIWTHFLDLKLTQDDGELYCFFTTGNVDAAKTVTDEEIVVMDVREVMDRCDTIPSLRWLIQMARSFPFGEHSLKFSAQEVPVVSIK